MTDNELDTAVREMREAHVALVPVPAEEMWTRIHARRSGPPVAVRHWLRIGTAVAASLLLVGGTVRVRHLAHREEAVASAANARLVQRHLAQSDTMIVAFVQAVAAGSWDDRFGEWARTLESATRQIQTSGLVHDPGLAMLLADVDFVLTQIAESAEPGANRSEESALISYSIRARAVVPRLRAASAVGAPSVEDVGPPANIQPTTTLIAGTGSPDSLFRAGREALANRDYLGAAALFKQLVDEYPASQLVGGALYWRGYALYSSGQALHDLDDLRAALEALDAQLHGHAVARAPGDYTVEAARELRARVLVAESDLHEPSAARALAAASHALDSQLSCNDPELQLDIVALEQRIDREAQGAIPAVERALGIQGTCADAVRRAVVTMLTHTSRFDMTALMMSIVRTDAGTRMEAIDALGVIGSTATTAFLDSVIAASGETSVRHQAVLALSLQRTPATTASLERLAAGGPSVPADLQMEARRRLQSEPLPGFEPPPPATRPADAATPLHFSVRTVVGSAALDGTDVASLLVDAKGSLFVGDRKQRRIIVFDSSGQRTGTIGRPGVGPGELSDVEVTGWLGDTLVVAERRKPHLTFFSRDGQWLGSGAWPSRAVDRLYSAGGRLFGGGLEASGPATANRLGGMHTNVVPSYFEIKGPDRTAPLTGIVDTFPLTSGMDCLDHVNGVIYILDATPAGDRGPMRAFTPLGQLIAGSRASLTLSAIEPRGASRPVEERAYPRLQMTDAAWARENTEVDTIPHDPAVKLECDPPDDRPAVQPVVRMVLADEKGRLWVELTADHGFDLEIIDLANHTVGEATMPDRDPSITPAVRGDRMYFVAEDANGAKSIMVYERR